MVQTDQDDVLSPWLALAIVVVLIAANAIFVAAEFALVSVPRGEMADLAERGDRRAVVVLRQLDRLSFVLSAAQFGITATSLLVGFLAEGAIGDTLVRPAFSAFGVAASSSAGVSIALAFLLSTMFQMVVGELAPKAIALARPGPTSRALAGILGGFGRVLGPVIRLFDHSAERLTSALGIELQAHGPGGLERDELAWIVAASSERGTLSQQQSSLLLRAVDLSERRAGEIMVPRPDVSWLDAHDTLDDLRLASKRTGFSRFPVHGTNEDEVLGTVHLKDLLQHDRSAWPHITVEAVAQAPLAVPESEPADRLLARMRATRRTFAIVVDEYGGTAGIVTLENVLEELVGDIQDEFDRDIARLRRVGAGAFTVQGALRATRFSEAFDIDLGSGDFETVAGFLLESLGHIPAVGEFVEHAGWRFEVCRIDGARIAELRLRRLPEVTE